MFQLIKLGPYYDIYAEKKECSFNDGKISRLISNIKDDPHLFSLLKKLTRSQNICTILA